MKQFDLWWRTLVLKRLNGLRSGGVHVVDDGGDSVVCGDPTNIVGTVSVHDSRFYRSVVLGGHIGAVEAYAHGWWDTDDLVPIVRLLVRERDVLDGLETGAVRFVKPVRAVAHWLERNTERGSRRNIQAHYDLGNEFFSTFLDDTMTYSCGFFPRETTSLRDASIAKYDRLCTKLELAQHHHVIEIGTGWGGFAIHAASRYGCRVTTTTISDEQFRLASARVAHRGLEDRVRVIRLDYRELRGTFDRLVSIEMIEAVGHQFLTTFFERCAALLKPDGLAAIQAITIQDRYYESARREVDFIKKYIFPGSFIPSLGALAQASGRTDLRLVHAEDIGLHYAMTLSRWRDTFRENESAIAALGFDDTFRRLWDFYFAYCEGGFLEGVLGDAQLVYAKPGAFLPGVAIRDGADVAAAVPELVG